MIIGASNSIKENLQTTLLTSVRLNNLSHDTNSNSNHETIPDSVHDSDPSSDPDSDPDYEPSDDEFNENIKKQPISPYFVERITQTKGSYRLCESLLKVGVEISGGDPNGYCLSRTNLWKQMVKERLKQREELHSFLAGDDSKVLIQFDGKNYKKLNERHMGIEERIIVMCHTERGDVPLGLFPVESKRSADCVPPIMNAIEKNSLQQRVVGLVCDTEAVNTGRLTGICVEIERALKTPVLHLMCRHHIFEVVLRDVFESIFGGTTGARITTFDILKESWHEIKSNGFRYTPLGVDEIAMVSHFSEDAIRIVSIHANHHHFRGDYAELHDLALKFLGIQTGKSFKIPGATNNARWMHRAIYAFKMYLFQNQIEMSPEFALLLHRFCMFVSLIYVKFWSSSAIAVDAPSNDIQFLKELDHYREIDREISEVALNAFQRHLWYLSDELILLSLFSNKVSAEEKFDLSLLLIKHVGNRTENSIKYSDVIDDIQHLRLDHFISPRSFFLLHILDIETSFLSDDTENWNKNEAYLIAQRKVQDLIVVVNDSSERALQQGAKLINGQRVQNESRLQDFIVSSYHSTF